MRDKILDFLLYSSLVDEDFCLRIQEEIKGEKLWDFFLSHEYFDPLSLEDIYLQAFRSKYVDLEYLQNNSHISEDHLLECQAQTLGLELLDLHEVSIDTELSLKLDINKLKAICALPICSDNINITVAFANPSAENITQASRLFHDKLIIAKLAKASLINQYLNKLNIDENIQNYIKQIRFEISNKTALSDNESSSVLELIKVIFQTAIISRASDIHIEALEKNCIIRIRIDGLLKECFIFPKDIFNPLSSRLKLLANLDISEKRKPQDGRFSANVLDKNYDFRLSSLPIVEGESLVIRILDKSSILISLDKLGMEKNILRFFKQSLKKPNGLILVTGPTGSGKTTTLYASLSEIKSVEKKIITIEDPVEYRLEGINQTAVNEKANLSFSLALRSILRQDPDIIMIGEIRDKQTLDIAIKASMTGHLVFSTLHTNDAISAISRISDMGVEAYLASSSLILIQAQRLVRKLCVYCKEKTSIDKNISSLQISQSYKAVGCAKCSFTGYQGRIMISEVLPISPALASLIAKKATEHEILKQAKAEGFTDLFTDGLKKVALGITSLDEIYRVAKT